MELQGLHHQERGWMLPGKKGHGKMCLAPVTCLGHSKLLGCASFRGWEVQLYHVPRRKRTGIFVKSFTEYHPPHPFRSNLG